MRMCDQERKEVRLKIRALTDQTRAARIAYGIEADDSGEDLA
jgi:hypothetical protein